MKKSKNPEKKEKYDFFGEWKRQFNNLRPTPPEKVGQTKKKNKWTMWLIYGLLFYLSLRGRALTNEKLSDLELLSASALMYSEPRSTNWIDHEWDFKTRTFRILYIELPFIPSVKTAEYQNGFFYNTTVTTDDAIEWYCKVYENPPKDSNLEWAFPLQAIEQYCPID